MHIQLPSNQLTVQLGPKNREVEKKTEIPKKFIRKIKKLGLRPEDAAVLYETKIDWETVYADNKIYCAETGCDFVTEIDNPALQEHTKKIHGYKDQPCEAKDCNYIGFSKKNLNIHNKMHTKYSGLTYVTSHSQDLRGGCRLLVVSKFISERRFENKCPMMNCGSSFSRPSGLVTHLRIHNNDVDKCQYCDFRYVYNKNYKIHLKE